MAVNRLTPLGDTGSIEADSTFEAWVENGWVDEWVKYKRFNKAFNRSDNKINEIINFGQGSGVVSSAHVLGVFDSSSHAPYDDTNIIDPVASTLGGTNNDFVYTKINSKNVILTVKGQSRLTIYDIDNMAFSEDVELTDLGISGTILSACGDGESVYVLYKVSGTPDEYWICAYNTDGWTVKSGWSGAVQLHVYEQSFDVEQAKIRMASATKVFVQCPWVDIDSGSDAAITIVDASDGTIDGVGSGDVASTTNGQIYRACSNGQYIFMLIYNGSDVVVSSMSIASPGVTGCGWTWLPSTYPVSISASEIGGIAVCGETVVVTYRDGSNIFSKLTTIQGYTAHFQTSNPDIIENLGHVCSDGVNFWAMGTRERQGSTNDILMFYRLDGVNIAGYYTTVSNTTESYSDGENFIKGFKADDIYRTATIFLDSIYLASDGDSIWSNVYLSISGRNTEIARLRRALFR